MALPGVVYEISKVLVPRNVPISFVEENAQGLANLAWWVVNASRADSDLRVHLALCQLTSGLKAMAMLFASGEACGMVNGEEVLAPSLRGLDGWEAVSQKNMTQGVGLLIAVKN